MCVSVISAEGDCIRYIPAFQQKRHEKTPEREKKNESGSGRGEKSAKCWGGPAWEGPAGGGGSCGGGVLRTSVFPKQAPARFSYTGPEPICVSRDGCVTSFICAVMRVVAVFDSIDALENGTTDQGTRAAKNR